MRTATFLMFSGDRCGLAEEAIGFWTSLLDGSRVVSLERFAEGEAGGRAGTVRHAEFELAGQRFMAHDSATEHAFGFTPSISLYVDCRDAAEVERLFAALSEGGAVLMPLGDYGFSARFGWVQDRYGVSWQLNLPREGA